MNPAIYQTDLPRTCNTTQSVTGLQALKLEHAQNLPQPIEELLEVAVVVVAELLEPGHMPVTARVVLEVLALAVDLDLRAVIDTDQVDHRNGFAQEPAIAERDATVVLAAVDLVRRDVAEELVAVDGLDQLLGKVDQVLPRSPAVEDGVWDVLDQLELFAGHAQQNRALILERVCKLHLHDGPRTVRREKVRDGVLPAMRRPVEEDDLPVNGHALREQLGLRGSIDHYSNPC